MAPIGLKRKWAGLPFTHVSAFVEEMNRAGADWQLIVYGGAMHGFTHEQAVGASAPGVAYHASADARSATAMAIFFGELFGPEASDGQPR